MLTLPNCISDVVLMVTEESFHGAFTGGGGDTGYWDTVLVSDWPTGASPKAGLPWVAQRARSRSRSTR